MRKKLCISKIISNLVVFKTLSINIRMHNLYANGFIGFLFVI